MDVRFDLVVALTHAQAPRVIAGSSSHATLEEARRALEEYRSSKAVKVAGYRITRSETKEVESDPTDELAEVLSRLIFRRS